MILGILIIVFMGGYSLYCCFEGEMPQAPSQIQKKYRFLGVFKWPLS